MAKYLSAEALGIKVWEHEKLIETRNLLSGDSCKTQNYKGRRRVKGALFNMDTAGQMCYIERDFSTTQCGTVACIGGWMHILHIHGFRSDGKYSYEDFRDAHRYVNNTRSETLYELFYPHKSPTFGEDYDYSKITDAQAVIAIDHFLTTGHVDWSHVKQRPQY